MKNRSRILVAVFGILLPLVCVGQYQRSDDDQRRDHDNDHGYGNADGRGGRLSADDQSRFDSYYSRWLDYRQTNNRDQMASMEQRMRDVMVHNSIPPKTASALIEISSRLVLAPRKSISAPPNTVVTLPPKKSCVSSFWRVPLNTHSACK